MASRVGNEAYISPAELQTLGQLNLDTGLIAINTAAQDGPKIGSLLKSDVTCWQLFLRDLGRGNLAPLQVHLTDIVPHLNRFDWTLGAEINNNAYLNVCRLAYKAFFSKGDETLLHNVASATVDKAMRYTYARNGIPEIAHDVVRTFKLNPLTQIKHLRAMIEKQYKPGWGVDANASHYSVQVPELNIVIQHNGLNVDPESYVSLKFLSELQIFIQASKSEVIFNREREEPVRREPDYCPPPAPAPQKSTTPPEKRDTEKSSTQTSTGYGGTKRR